MKKRILALVLALATFAGVLPLAASAVPYAPSANAWKDFGQQHFYLYEVTKGEAAPKMDGSVSDTDGYGEPIATYGFRYTTTAERVTSDIDNGEFKLRPDGTYNVYPTPESTQEVWDAIRAVENDSPYGFIWAKRMIATSFSTSENYYYQDPDTLAFARAWHLTKETLNNYTVLDRQGQYVLKDIVKLTEQPADWETNFANYYKKFNSYLPVEPTEDGKAPAFTSGTYYSGRRTTVKHVYAGTGSNYNSIANVNMLKAHHVILPEEINVYARYDNDYLYYAIELKETPHQTTYYRSIYQFGTTMSNVSAIYSGAFDFNPYISLDPEAGKTPTIGISAVANTYVTSAQNMSSSLPIIRKYGNLNATDISQVSTLGVDYNITHKPYEKKTPEIPEDSFDYNYMEEDSRSEELKSGTYGTTTYEYRVPWKVLNGKYNPKTDATAIPEVFSLRAHVELENSLARDIFQFTITMPKDTRALAQIGGSNYPKENFVMRYPHRTGLTEGEAYGTYNFLWGMISNAYGNFEPYVTDYAGITNRKVAVPTHIPYVYYPAGQKPQEGYTAPEYLGTQIRADGAENQKMRIQFGIPTTSKEIEEAGVIIAPTEAARRNQLRLGMSSIAYYCEDYPVLYGVDENGNWVNMPEETEKWFNNANVPNDSDSFAAMDVYGGKPSGIYTVYTLAADLDNPYGKYTDENGVRVGNSYTVVFGGANGEGLYHDFDDFFTFYTIRPYVKYQDGTVLYGEHEYKSIYYLACWTIQEMISDYNEQVAGGDGATALYNMDQMYLSTVTDKSGKTLKDPEGKSLYLPVAKTDSGFSPYAGDAEKSLYLPEPREQIFRWWAVRTLNRRNSTSLRVEYYDTFHEDVKVLVDQYVQMYENLWNIIVECENTRYIEMK